MLVDDVIYIFFKNIGFNVTKNFKWQLHLRFYSSLLGKQKKEKKIKSYISCLLLYGASNP